eukprot:TRINITY_DN21265_c0_g2_i1.p1 TRINITY_DN21265_c0_g2~~TRINITY_DN21265_c0_g2_i1.p1  ORF type:complete len:681 (-),score=107.41 TRINITY_DN21265_c0_g2_i1:247-2238(-)
MAFVHDVWNGEGDSDEEGSGTVGKANPPKLSVIAPKTSMRSLPELNAPQSLALRIVDHVVYQGAVSCCVMFHFYITVRETDQRALDIPGSRWQKPSTVVLSIMYIVDIAMRIYVFQMSFFKSGMNMFDLCIVALDVTLGGMEVMWNSETTNPMSVFRGLQALRMFRVVRKFAMFRDLYMMMKGMVGAMRAIFFSSLFIGLVLTMFSIIAVEVIEPINRNLAAEDTYPDCARCHRAFSTVMSSNLTFFTSILAGDSWGQVAVPIMEREWWTAFIIVTAFLVVELGLLNVVVAVVVDRQAQAREEDKALQYAMKKEQSDASYRHLINLFKSMDDDNSGTLTLNELEESFAEHVEFQDMLRFMDICGDDLPIVFRMMDRDGGGKVDYEEFVKLLHNLRTLDMRTLMFLTRQHTIETKEIIVVMQSFLERKFREYDEVLRSLGLMRVSEDHAQAVHEAEVEVAKAARKMARRSCAPSLQMSTCPPSPTTASLTPIIPAAVPLLGFVPPPPVVQGITKDNNGDALRADTVSSEVEAAVRPRLELLLQQCEELVTRATSAAQISSEIVGLSTSSLLGKISVDCGGDSCAGPLKASPVAASVKSEGTEVVFSHESTTLLEAQVSRRESRLDDVLEEFVDERGLTFPTESASESPGHEFLFTQFGRQGFAL